MIPIAPWQGPRFSHDTQQRTAAVQRLLTPEQYYANTTWNMDNLDSLEGGLFTKVTLAAHVGNCAVIQDLIGRGASLTKKSQGDFTALHAAVQAKHVDAVSCLVGAAGTALANSTCAGGLTPLMLACAGTMPLALAKVLIPVSDVRIEDTEGRRAFDHARLARRVDIESLLELEAGAATDSLSRIFEPAAPPSLETLRGLFLDVAAELAEWRYRTEEVDFLQIAPCWSRLQEMFHLSSGGEHINELPARRMIAELNAVRVRILQRNPNEPEIDLLPETHQALCARIAGQIDKLCEHQTSNSHGGTGTANSTTSSLPVTAALIPTRLLLLSVEQAFLQQRMPLQEAERYLERACKEVEAWCPQ